jgi:ribA/ribD-fused uncharacterized protein
MEDHIVFFKGPNNPLSNLFHCPLQIEGHNFNSSESAYQFIKVRTMACTVDSPQESRYLWDKANQIVHADNSLTAMFLGRIPTNHIWAALKEHVMKSVLVNKYAQCAQYRDALYNTGSNYIVENTQNEFWGQGRQSSGRNVLGNIHQDIRTRFTYYYPTLQEQTLTNLHPQCSCTQHPGNHHNIHK